MGLISTWMCLIFDFDREICHKNGKIRIKNNLLLDVVWGRFLKKTKWPESRNGEIDKRLGQMAMRLGRMLHFEKKCLPLFKHSEFST